MTNIAIFASGTGSNARKIVEYFEGSPSVTVALIASNRKDAPVLDFAREKGIPVMLLNRKSFYETQDTLLGLQSRAIDLIVLAGFLWLVPSYFIRAFENRIINIHPALLPKFGGKGMYGHFVHEAVLGAGERESGITIHLVDEQYDHGKTLFQASCPVKDSDTPETLARSVQQLEHLYFPKIIDQYIRETLPKNNLP
ncbi:MAG: phosphoribosylglycinamide formyltransferase [Saprospiraceae bacterium]